MPGLTVVDIFEHVKRAFGDESGVQITESDIIRWINDGQREAVMQNEELLPVVRYLDLNAQSGTMVMQPDLFSVHHIYCKTNEQGAYYKLKWLSMFEMSVYMDGWDGSQIYDFPRVYNRDDPIAINLFPIPPTTVHQGLKLHAARYANEVTDGASVIDIPPYLHNMLVNYCLVQAYEMDEDWASSQIKAAQVQGDLDFNNNRGAWYGRDSYPVISDRFGPAESDY